MIGRVPIALPWYRRGDYPLLLALFSDPQNLPESFEAWLQHAEHVEKQLQGVGFAVVRISILPQPFATWCRERGVSADQRARLTFANEAARAHHSRLDG
jgi:hypothetical protein